MSIMRWGLLWYEEEGALEDRVRNAALRYKEKHGKRPDTCYVYSKDASEDIIVDGCRVIGNPSILENHFWIGVAG
jgi:hypothetical protein